ncbi:MAG: hypothetical protein Q8R63_06020, partial [Ramlibacter sp.]|nr:hypothetical protein [Ramlibacter sp.]
AAPTPAPTAAPTPAPTAAPTPAPTAAPTPAPTAAPTPAPSPAPTAAPQPPPPPPTSNTDRIVDLLGEGLRPAVQQAVAESASHLPVFIYLFNKEVEQQRSGKSREAIFNNVQCTR